MKRKSEVKNNFVFFSSELWEYLSMKFRVSLERTLFRCSRDRGERVQTLKLLRHFSERTSAKPSFAIENAVFNGHALEESWTSTAKLQY